MAIEDEGIIVRPDSAMARPDSGNGTQLVRHGFGEQSMERRDTAATAAAARAQAEIQARYIVALQRPRNLDEVRIRLLAHTRRPLFAAKARYSKPVGGEKIQGASIRFVETALQEYGNVIPESAVTHDDADQIKCRVSVTDLERNITHAVEVVIDKQVERRFADRGQRVIKTRLNKQGQTVYIVEATADDVANKKASAESKAIRNLGLRILPADLVDEAMESCVKTILEGVKKDPAGERKALMDGFATLGVMPKQLEEYLGHPLDQLVPAELVDLREIYVALRDGETTWVAVAASKREADGQAGPAEPAAKGTAAAAAKLAGRGKATAAAKPAEAAAPATTAPAKGSAPIDAVATETAPKEDDPDDLAKAYEDLHAGLERVLAEPDKLPGYKERVTALPDGGEKATLQQMIVLAERELAERAKGKGK